MVQFLRNSLTLPRNTAHRNRGGVRPINSQPRRPRTPMIVPSIITTHELTRTYRSHLALSNVTLTVTPGSVYALVGPNGAGKTTLIQLLMNLQPATSGSAEILGL